MIIDTRLLSRWAARLGTGFLLFALVAEGAVRVAEPTPRTQIIRSTEARSMVLSVEDGVPLWSARDPAWRALREPACIRTNAPKIVLVGDSVLFVTGEESPDDNVGARLQARLGDGYCVINLAHSGYSAAQKATTLIQLLGEVKPVAVLWEVWGEGPTYRAVGDDFFAIGSYERDADGNPTAPGLRLPPAIHGALFRTSRAYELYVLTLGANRAPEDVTVWHRKALDALEAAEVPVTFFFFPDLKGPFGEAPRTLHASHPPLRALLAERGVPVVEVSEALRGQDYLALRLDPCCHYNPAGHDAIAALFADWWRDHPG